MKLPTRLARCCRGSAAAEMAIVTPLLLIILGGSLELGNYFLDEHVVAKAVRDGARFAARQSFTYYTACTGDPGGTVKADTVNVVRTGLLSGGTDQIGNLGSATIDVTHTCTTTVSGQTMSGIYNGRASGAARVKVEATVPYQSILGSFGFPVTSLNLYAKSEAAVMGV